MMLISFFVINYYHVTAKSVLEDRLKLVRYNFILRNIFAAMHVQQKREIRPVDTTLLNYLRFKERIQCDIQ